MYRNTTKQRLAAGQVAFGLGVRSSRTVEVALAAAAADYHYLFIDLEHSTIDLDCAAQISATGLACGITPIVRVPSVEYAELPRLLDGGAQGIVVPHVDNAKEARRAVEVCLQPPRGLRSSAGAAIQTGWKNMSSADTAKAVNDSTLVIVMVETATSLANVEEIAAVEGVDIISVGTNDLSLDLGIPNDFEHPQIKAAHEKVVAAARKHGKAVRLGGRYDDNDIIGAIKRGSRLVTLGSDQAMLLAAMRAKQAVISGSVAKISDLASIIGPTA